MSSEETKDDKHEFQLSTPGVLAFGCSDVGMVREGNQDNYLLNEGLRLFVVADGMGGHNGGEVASELAVEEIDRFVDQRMYYGGLEHEGPIEKHPAIELMSTALKSASARVFRQSMERPDLQGMGTTCTGISFHDGYAFVGHVGDSRVYLIRGEHIEQLSEDHSMVAEMVRAGMMTQEQADQSHMKNIITRSIGVEEEVAVDTIVVQVMVGDVFMLCSDGLINLVRDFEILDIVRDSFLSEAAGRLVDLANARGGDDNITVLVVYVEDVDALTQPSSQAPARSEAQ